MIDHTDEWRFSCHGCDEGHRSKWYEDKDVVLWAMDRHVKRLHSKEQIVSIDLEIGTLTGMELITVYRYEND